MPWQKKKLLLACPSPRRSAAAALWIHRLMASLPDSVSSLPAPLPLGSWNSRILACHKLGESRRVLSLYHEMQEANGPPQLSGYAIVAVLKACAVLKDLEEGIKLHLLISQEGLVRRNIFIGSSLVAMYVKCGAFAKAEELFDELPKHDVVLWNTLISGYSEHGRSKDAFRCFTKMQSAGVSWNAVTFICSLKACVSIEDKVRGEQIHGHIVRNGWDFDCEVGNALVGMYANCGMLLTAERVLFKLPFRDIVSWNTLLARYAEQGHGEKALHHFEKLPHEGISFNSITSVCILKACSSEGDVMKGHAIYTEIVTKGFEGDLLVGSTLVDMYSKFGLLRTARALFAKLKTRDTVSWTALLSGYGEYGYIKEMLECFKQMQDDGIFLNDVTFVWILKACCHSRDMIMGLDIHATITKMGLEREVFIGNTLVDLYGKCGSLDLAHEVFRKLPFQDTVSWNALISGYVEHGYSDQALGIYEEARHKGIHMNAITYLSVLKACANLKVIAKGQEIHTEISSKGLEVGIGNASMLINMYARCGLLTEAEQIFDTHPCRDVNSWNLIIEGYCDHACFKEALNYYVYMFKEGFSPNTFTFVCILRISTSMECADKGKEIHSDITKLGLEQETLVANTLVYMYSKHGLSAAAWQVHSSLPIRDVVSWTALLAGCVERRRGQDAFHCFETMKHDAVSSNAVTLVCLLKVCGMARARAGGQEMHAEIVQKGLENDPFIRNTLIDMYAKCGSLNTAEDMFDKISVHDIVCWNVLLSGYVDNGFDEEVLICIEQLQHESIHPNIITYVCSLKACGNIGAVVKGQEVHSEIIKKGLDRDPVVGNSLIDMYAKCGLIIESKNMFDELEVRDQISWNALISGFAQLGEIEEVSTFFNTMREEGIEPNLLTFLSILNTCSHAGLVEIGQIIFDAISNLYGFIRTVEHFTCMVDLLGRAGHIETALLMIRRMPLHPGIVAWHAVLGACRKWGDIEIGREAFDHAMGLDESSTAAHLCMINIFSDAATQKGTRS